MRDIVSEILVEIHKRHVGERFILGIDGLSRSGKTTLAEALRDELLRAGQNVCVFHMDNHIVDRNKRYHTGHEPWYEYYALQWDVEYLRENLFMKLRRSREIILNFYNDDLNKQFVKTVLIPDRCVVIVEGVFLQRPAWREFLDYCVYLDCPREVRFARERASVQAAIEKFKNRYWKAEDHYLESVRPLAAANMVVSTRQ
ncbi:kinase [Alicyclobacillus macrosporangiidus]|uniref:Uridine kinase n=1 Tax=Alicyclobacillus macrosporangiidus TaxID=392015 RepID=A0A1I7KNP5_9BACL|nr:uridine kinase [Alicyclobacillus macrosporangiidus]